jgi:O-antigen/teichoic acid export membrane protein
MIFNLAQKYASVLSSLINTALILAFLGVEHLGLYAFLTASGNIFAVFVPLGLRSVYLREVVKFRHNRDGQIVFTVLAEIVPKVSAIVMSAVFFAVALLFELSTVDTFSIAIIGSMLASVQLSAQKLRSHGLNSLSQFILNVRPIVFTVLLLCIGMVDKGVLQKYYHFTIIISFAIPAVSAYLFWLVRFRGLIFKRVGFSAIVREVQTLLKELPGLFMLALGQKVIAKSDVILVTALLNLDAAGIYRLGTQIVTVANSSLFPLRSRFLKKYSRLLDEGKLEGAEDLTRRIARTAVPLYLLILVAALVAVYQGPYLVDIKYREDFIWSLGILSLVGLIRAKIPMIENYVVYRNNTNRGALILVCVVIINVLMHLMLIPLIGLPGACLTAVFSVMLWRFTVKRFL